jgi:hypothetical protein
MFKISNTSARGRWFGLILDTCPAKYDIYLAGSKNQTKKTNSLRLCAENTGTPIK